MAQAPFRRYHPPLGVISHHDDIRLGPRRLSDLGEDRLSYLLFREESIGGRAEALEQYHERGDESYSKRVLALGLTLEDVAVQQQIDLAGNLSRHAAKLLRERGLDGLSTGPPRRFDQLVAINDVRDLMVE